MAGDRENKSTIFVPKNTIAIIVTNKKYVAIKVFLYTLCIAPATAGHTKQRRIPCSSCNREVYRKYFAMQRITILGCMLLSSYFFCFAFGMHRCLLSANRI
jgi:hypothetical protein